MLKAAVIGCGRMGAEPSARLLGQIPPGWLPISHVEAIQQTPSLHLAALADVNAERLSWVGQQYGITALFSDYASMLKQLSPDIVSIATRTPEKPAIIKQAITSGVKGLYVEKPLANTLADTRDLLSQAEDCGTRINYGVNRRHHTLYRQARDLIRSGDLGEVLEVLVEFGESALFWTHPHSVDLMLFLTGQKPVSVQADLVPDTFQVLADKTVDCDPRVASAHFWFDGGSQGFILRGNGCHVKVNCSRGSVEIVSDGTSMHIKRRGNNSSYYLQQEVVYPLNYKSATVVALDELAQAIINPQLPHSITNNEILWGMEMLIGCVFSQLAGSQRCALVNIPPELKVTGRTGQLYA